MVSHAFAVASGFVKPRQNAIAFSCAAADRLCIPLAYLPGRSPKKVLRLEARPVIIPAQRGKLREPKTGGLMEKYDGYYVRFLRRPLRDIWRVCTGSRLVLDGSFYFHEDDFGNIQLLPTAAWEYCRQELDQIQTFADEHHVGDGQYSQIYMRPERASIAVLGIKLDDVDQVLRMLPRQNSVSTGYSTHVEQLDRTVAFGLNPDCAIYVDFNEAGIVTSCWCLLIPKQPAHLEVMLSALTSLGKAWDLLLVGWGQGGLVTLKDVAAVRHYLDDTIGDRS